MSPRIVVSLLAALTLSLLAACGQKGPLVLPPKVEVPPPPPLVLPEATPTQRTDRNTDQKK